MEKTRHITIPASYLTDSELEHIAQRITRDIVQNDVKDLIAIAALNMLREEQKERTGK